jgi:nondiscriminating glutamyl-tRNA synthetase
MFKKIRVRFAPSPTGFMHLGNIRTALFNYLFAQQKKATFVLRIEDTDESRNVDEAVFKIIQDLKWLGLRYKEGPIVGGKYAPYNQSERKHIYQQHLDDLILSQKVYRCFCSQEELEKKRQDQIAKKLPPRYDGTCLHLSEDHIKQKIAFGKKFIWRFKIDTQKIVELNTLERGILKFDLKNFSDFALTRQDESFTFLFANFIDDWLMKISHVIRGEDHLTNTAMQAALFDALAIPTPTFWHLPMICNKEGKKMSKRDFGFSLDDLKKAGFLPEAICNYLATIGGSFKEEVQSLKEFSRNFDFKNIHTTGSIKYDIEKLTWFNHKWISRLTLDKVVTRAKPFLFKEFPESKKLNDEKLSFFIEKIKEELKTLNETPKLLAFCFENPKINKKEIEEKIGKEKTKIALKLITENVKHIDDINLFLNTLKKEAKELELKIKEIFSPLRYLLTGTFKGLGIHDILEMLTKEQIVSRLK